MGSALIFLLALTAAGAASDIHSAHPCADSVGLSTASHHCRRARESGGHSSVIRAQVPGTGRLLVLYQYYEAPKAADNLRYFLAKTIFEPTSQRQRDAAAKIDRVGITEEEQDESDEGVDYVFIISGYECSVKLPEGPDYPHVQVLAIDNTGSDFGAWADALRILGLYIDDENEESAGSSSSTDDVQPMGQDWDGTRNAEQGEHEKGPFHRYGAFAFINSSCR